MKKIELFRNQHKKYSVGRDPLYTTYCYVSFYKSSLCSLFFAAGCNTLASENTTPPTLQIQANNRVPSASPDLLLARAFTTHVVREHTSQVVRVERTPNASGAQAIEYWYPALKLICRKYTHHEDCYFGHFYNNQRRKIRLEDPILIKLLYQCLEDRWNIKHTQKHRPNL